MLFSLELVFLDKIFDQLNINEFLNLYQNTPLRWMCRNEDIQDKMGVIQVCSLIGSVWFDFLR